MMTCHSVSSGFLRGGITGLFMHARLAWPGCGRPSTPAWRRPASGQPWPLASRPSSSSWPPSRSRCWCPATARRAARARRPTRRRAIRRNGGNAGRDAGGPRRGRARPRCLQHPRRPLTRPRRLRPRRLRLRIPPRLRRSPPRLRPVPRRAAHPDTQGITAAEPGESRAATDHARTPRSALHRRQAPKAKQPHRTAARRAFSLASLSLSVMPPVGVARCRPSARCGGTGL